MTTEVHTIGFYITIVQAAICFIYSAALLSVSRELPSVQGHGLFALSHQHRLLRLWMPFVLVVFCLIPVLIFSFSNAAGAILSLVEGWNFMKAFEYVIGNLQSLDISNLRPDTSIGNAVDAFICVFAMAFASLIMGICAQLAVVSHITEILSDSFLNFVCVYGVVMIFIFIVCCVLAITLQMVEVDMTYGDAFLYLVSQVTGVQNPLTAQAPHRHLGFYISGYSTVVALSLGGAINGLLGGHPFVVRLIALLEATPQSECLDEVTQEKSQDAKLLELEGKVEKLQSELMAKTLQCAELERNISGKTVLHFEI